MKLLLVLPCLAVLIFTACGKKEYRPQAASFEECLKQDKMFVNGSCVAGSSHSPDNTRYRFVHDHPFSQVFQKDHISICVIEQDASAGRELVLADQIRQAILMWIEPVKELGIALSPTISVAFHWKDHDSLCTSASDAFVHLHRDLSDDAESKGRAYARSQHSEIHLSFADVDSDNGTILHEFGHLFGLADTYIEGKFDCRPEFPNSLMCDSAWKTLLPIDREQIQRLYCLETKGALPACFNHEIKEILALPQEPLYENARSPSRPYLTCEDENDRIEVSHVSILRVGAGVLPRLRTWATREPFYSTDAHSVLETYANGRAQLDFKVDDVEKKELAPEIRTLRLQLDGNAAILEFDDAGEKREKTFTNCYFTKDIMQYFSGRGIDTAASLFAHNDFHSFSVGRGQPQPGMLDQKREIVKYWMHFSPRNPPDTIHVFGTDKKLIKTLPLTAVAALTPFDMAALPFVTVEVKKLNLAAGSYVLVFAKDNDAMLLGNLEL